MKGTGCSCRVIVTVIVILFVFHKAIWKYKYEGMETVTYTIIRNIKRVLN